MSAVPVAVPVALLNIERSGCSHGVRWRESPTTLTPSRSAS